MNSNQVLSLVRSILLGAGATLVTKGVVDQTGLEQIVGGLLALASVVWSQFHHSDPAK
jgi:hypothetical protein